MKYLIRNTGENVKAHIWNKHAKDTECFMWSTGGMNKKKFSLHKTTKGKELCMMCTNNVMEQKQHGR